MTIEKQELNIKPLDRVYTKVAAKRSRPTILSSERTKRQKKIVNISSVQALKSVKTFSVELYTERLKYICTSVGPPIDIQITSYFDYVLIKLSFGDVPSG